MSGSEFTAKVQRLKGTNQELLEVCKTIESTLIPYRGQDASSERAYLCSRNAIQLLRAAIDKAEGRMLP